MQYTYQDLKDAIKWVHNFDDGVLNLYINKKSMPEALQDTAVKLFILGIVPEKYDQAAVIQSALLDLQNEGILKPADFSG